MAKGKIVLVSSGISRKEYPQFERFMPMTAVGLHYIKAVLEDSGYLVRLINQTNDTEISDKSPYNSDINVSKKIDEYKPDIVLFNQFFSIRQRIRENIIPNLKGKYIIGVGGHDATFNSRELSLEELSKEYSQFNFIWQGEAEKGLSQFLREVKKNQPLQIIDNLENRVKNLNELPILLHNDYDGDVGFLSTSRGCLPKKSACYFCTTGLFYPEGWKARSIDHVIPELENLVNNGKKYVFITDDNFLGFSKRDLKRGDEIINYASELGLKLMIMTIKEQILKANKEGYLPKWRSTVFRVFLGIENGSRESALKLGKCSARHDVDYSEHCKDAISTLYDNGISLFGGYINFNPATTIEELEESAKFLRDNGKEAANFTNLSQGLRFYEGTKVCQIYLKQAKNHEIREGEFFYEFEHPKVQKIYEHLFDVKKLEDGLMGRIDSMNYELTDLTYINQIQDTELGKKYFQIAEKRNQLNANYFLELCQKAREGEEFNYKNFIKESIQLESQYQMIHQEIERNVKYK